ncbi:UNVERIFIED_CONTAM: hypothetical protein Sradi_4518600 [Sesamum radiatum]|uniref:Uncharacterized protein n=1 Tax=Sesamum radiatum TaxID=300843 RepID=A0AAW2NA76_SESRA
MRAVDGRSMMSWQFKLGRMASSLGLFISVQSPSNPRNLKSLQCSVHYLNSSGVYFTF